MSARNKEFNNIDVVITLGSLPCKTCFINSYLMCFSLLHNFIYYLKSSVAACSVESWKDKKKLFVQTRVCSNF